MKKISSLVITSILFLFLYLSFFRSFPVSSASHFFLATNNKKNKKVYQNKKANSKRLEKSKKDGKESSSQEYSFLDNKENILFLFFFGVSLIIFIFFFLYLSFPLIVEKFKNKKEEEDKKTKMNRIANQLLSRITKRIFMGKRILDEKNKVCFTFDFFNYHSLIYGLNDYEITNNFLNSAFEESFRQPDNTNSRGLNFTEIVEKIADGKIKKIEFFYGKNDFLKYYGEGKNLNADENVYCFIFEDFVKTFFDFFTIGYRAFSQEYDERDVLSRNTISHINGIVNDFFLPLNQDYSINILKHDHNKEYSNELVADTFYCAPNYYEHEYRGGDEGNFCRDREGCKKLPKDNEILDPATRYERDRNSLRSLGRRKRDGQDIKFKNFYVNWLADYRKISFEDIEKNFIFFHQEPEFQPISINENNANEDDKKENFLQSMIDNESFKRERLKELIEKKEVQIEKKEAETKVKKRKFFLEWRNLILKEKLSNVFQFGESNINDQNDNKSDWNGESLFDDIKNKEDIKNNNEQQGNGNDGATENADSHEQPNDTTAAHAAGSEQPPEDLKQP